MAAFGAFVKMGDEQVTITPTNVDYDDKSYSTANYVLMGAGALMFLIGMTMVTSNPSQRNHAFIDVDQSSTIVGINWSF